MKIKPMMAAVSAVSFLVAAYSGIASAQPFSNPLANSVVRQEASVQPAKLAQATAPPEARQAVTAQPEMQEVKVTVQPGDSLAKIAAVHQTSYDRLYDANLQVEYPHLVHPGDEIRIPRPEEQLTSRALPAPAPEPVVRTFAPSQVAEVVPVEANVGVWDRLAQCESGGKWSINTGNGYYGGLQFSLSSWQAAGGSGYPHQASKAEQIARAERLLTMQGWGAWPACTAKLGIR